MNSYPLLSQVDSPADLRAIEETSLPQLAAELQQFLVDTVSETGGHFAANLGTVELTVALHYVFNTPDDKLVWDVGHQTYPHKILTGRRDQMKSIRKRHGLSGFPKRAESEYDTFGVGHSSTSISAALGMALAARSQQKDNEVIAVIGDGAMTAGMAFEALNHAGDAGADMLVILNDNDMSISPNVGGMSHYLTRILSSQLYTNMREGSKRVLSRIPNAWEVAKRAEEHMKGMVIPGTLFEELGFNYVGPIDGHDIPTLVQTLRNLKKIKGPRFLHVVTKKGKGYKPAEDNPCAYHGVSCFDVATGKSISQKSEHKCFTDIFSGWLTKAGEQHDDLVAITPAMCEGSGLQAFAKQFPDRYYDVGIAEQHAVTLAAGLATEGMKPVVAIYSTFLQRAYDQLIHDVALQNLPVLFAVDRAGIVGPDEPTHSGMLDLSYARCIPNMTIMTPSNLEECHAMLDFGFKLGQPAMVRYPKAALAPSQQGMNQSVELGKANVLRKGHQVALLMFGPLIDRVLPVADQLNATLVDMRFVKPVDLELLTQLAESHDLFITVEDNVLAGGAGSAVLEACEQAEIRIDIHRIGLPDEYLPHGTRNELLDEAGFSSEAILKFIEKHYNSKDCKSTTRQLSF